MNLLSPGSFLPARRMESRMEGMWTLEVGGPGPEPPSLKLLELQEITPLL